MKFSTPCVAPNIVARELVLDFAVGACAPTALRCCSLCTYENEYKHEREYEYKYESEYEYEYSCSHSHSYS